MCRYFFIIFLSVNVFSLNFILLTDIKTPFKEDLTANGFYINNNINLYFNRTGSMYVYNKKGNLLKVEKNETLKENEIDNIRVFKFEKNDYLIYANNFSFRMITDNNFIPKSHVCDLQNVVYLNDINKKVMMKLAGHKYSFNLMDTTYIKSINLIYRNKDFFICPDGLMGKGLVIKYYNKNGVLIKNTTLSNNDFGFNIGILNKNIIFVQSDSRLTLVNEDGERLFDKLVISELKLDKTQNTKWLPYYEDNYCNWYLDELFLYCILHFKGISFVYKIII